MLDEVEDVKGSLKEFASELEGRIAALRRQFAIEPWKSEHPNLTDALAGCADLLKDPPDAPPEGGWTTEELIERDLCAIKLAIVHRMITLAARLTADSAVDAFVASRLESDNAAQLAEAQTALSMLSDGVSDQAIQDAFTGGKWDALYEPATVTDQDVVRASFQFRDMTLNACASKSGFRCWWHIHVDGDDGQDPVDLDEPGWEVQFIPQRGRMTVQPSILDRTGNVLSYSSPAGQPVKGLFDTRVRQPGANTALSRALRGLLDAALTALVPVVTVAVTQAQNKVSVGQLILIGFTSQAIRAAVVPESVTTPRDTRSAPPTSP